MPYLKRKGLKMRTFSKIDEKGDSITYYDTGFGHVIGAIVADKNGIIFEEGPVLRESVSEDPKDFENIGIPSGEWTSYYKYEQGADKKDYICSKKNWVNGRQEGAYVKYYSPDEKKIPLVNRVMEEGVRKAGDLDGVVKYITMDGKTHKCEWRNGKAYNGTCVDFSMGESKRTWKENFYQYKNGKLDLSGSRLNVYVRKNMKESYVLYGVRENKNENKVFLKMLKKDKER